MKQMIMYMQKCVHHIHVHLLQGIVTRHCCHCPRSDERFSFLTISLCKNFNVHVYVPISVMSPAKKKKLKSGALINIKAILLTACNQIKPHRMKIRTSRVVLSHSSSLQGQHCYIILYYVLQRIVIIHCCQFSAVYCP